MLNAVGQLLFAVGGIDVHQYRPNAGHRKLHDHPFHSIGAPNANAVAFFNPKRQERLGRLLDQAVQLAKAQALGLGHGHKRSALTVLAHHPLEKTAHVHVKQGQGTICLDVR